MAEKTVDSYQAEGEREALETSVATYQLGKNTSQEGIEDSRLGKGLVDRNAENGDSWDIVVEREDYTTYGSDWNYVEEGTNLGGYGNAKHNWVVNYETGEIIELEDETYDEFTYLSTVGVPEGLLFNIDSSNVSLNPESWGKDTKLYYYDDQTYKTKEQIKEAFENEKKLGDDIDSVGTQGYDRQEAKSPEAYIDDSTGAFKFNGNNYIEFSEENGFDFSNGLTFEFYGVVEGHNSVSLFTDYPDNTCLFSFWNRKNRCIHSFEIFDSGRITLCPA